MCNAWNHSPGCTCGWGGVGHLGRGQSGSFSSRDYYYLYAGVRQLAYSYESFVNPNASCPVCGASVFFYQSPNGGRVFFDELGPPWPRHPCTSNSSIPAAEVRRVSVSGYNDKGLSSEKAPASRTTSRDIVRTSVTAAKTSRPATDTHHRQLEVPSESGSSANLYAWQREGWQPFFISLVYEVDKYFVQIKGNHAGKDIALYARKANNSPGQANTVTKGCFAHLRKSAENQYHLSLVTELGTILNVNAYTLLHLAHQDARATSPTKQTSMELPRTRKVKRQKTPAVTKGSHQEGKKKARSQKIGASGKTTLQALPNKPTSTSALNAKPKILVEPSRKKPEITAMSLAFAAAKRKLP